METEYLLHWNLNTIFTQNQNLKHWSSLRKIETCPIASTCCQLALASGRWADILLHLFPSILHECGKHLRGNLESESDRRNVAPPSSATPTCTQRRFLLSICVLAMAVKSVCDCKSSGRRLRNWAMWIKSICSRTSSNRRRIPKAVRNRDSSPSRQNTSQTRHATSRGRDLL